MFLWKNVANYPKIIPVTPSYLEHCQNDSFFYQHLTPKKSTYYTVPPQSSR